MMQKLKESAKMLAALVGALITAGSTMIPESWGPWLSLLFAVLTAIATYTIPNAPTRAQRDTVLAKVAVLDPDEQNTELQAARARVEA